MKRRVTTADFDAVRATANDVKMLRRFVDQEGTAAITTLEDVIERGGGRMRKAAWLSLAELDLPSAEAKALASADAGWFKKRKPRTQALEPLHFVATPACLERSGALGVEVTPGSLADQSFARAQAWAMELLLRSPDLERQRAVLAEWFPRYHLNVGALGLLRSSLERPSLLARRNVLQILLEARDPQACRRDDVPDELVIEARFVLPADEAFDRLRPFFESRPLERGLLIRTLARQPGRDPRWVALFASLDDQSLRLSGLLATRRTEALALLAPVISSLPPGPELLAVLTALRGFDSPTAAELLLPWLERSELDGNAALLATSLRACGAPEHEAALQAAAKRNPDGAIFYLEAVSHIQARHRS